MLGYILERSSQFALLRKKMGLKQAIRYALKRIIAKRSRSPISLGNKTDVIGFYDFVNSSPFGNSTHVDSSDRVLTWVIPDFGPGSGGHINIFRLIKALETKGLVCRIVIVGPCQFSTGTEAKESISSLFCHLDADVSIGRESLIPSWGCVATSWQTAYVVRDFNSVVEKFYFIQDYEPYFYARGSEYYFAEQTYHFGFRSITAGDWLANKMRKEYGSDALSYGFSYDKDLYFPRERKNDGQKRIFFYARPVTDRRAFELGLLVLKLVASHIDDVAVIFAGWDVSQYDIPFHHLNAGIVSVDELPDLYSNCDVSLVISATNISLLPLEIMACGCPVVSNYGENVEWLLDDNNSVLSNPNVEDLSNSIIKILEEDDYREAVINSAMSFARSTSWDVEADKVVKYIKELHG